jgi:hypothetical protein
VKALIYDIEIINAIPERNPDDTEIGITYCGGWHDHANMGISVIGGYEYDSGRYRVFCTDNMHEFADAIERADVIVGFNNIAFDNAVIRACWGPLVKLPEGWEAKSYDLLVETWRAVGLGPAFNFKTHGGYGLDAMCEANFGTKKSGNGALAPKWWQRGMTGNVIDYCLNDIALTKQLFDAVLNGDEIMNPKVAHADGTLKLRLPTEAHF